MAEKFYYLKVINSRKGTRGYIGEDSKGEIIISDKFFQGTKMFPTYQEAQKFMREKKIERNGVTAHIRDNEDLMKEVNLPGGDTNIKPVNGDVYMVENLSGQKCFFDPQIGYFFKDGEIGACAWFSEEEVNEFIKNRNFPFEVKPYKLQK